MSRQPFANRHVPQSTSPEEEVAALRRELFNLVPAVVAICGTDHPVFHLLARSLTRGESSVQDVLHWLRLAQFAVTELPGAIQQRLRTWPRQITDTPPVAPAPDLQLTRSGSTVLVVIGDRPGAGAAAAILGAVDCAVHPVHDGLAARQEVSRLRPALVILDILLPGDDDNDGVSLLLDLLDEGIPVLVLCTEPLASMESQIAFLSRIFAPDDLLAAVGQFLATRHQAGDEPPRP